MKIRWGALAFLGVCAIHAAPALALETGQCLPAAQVRSALAAEGMNPIIIGNRTGYGYPTALIFTANADGSKGYAIRGDKPLGQQAETICIDSEYRDIRLNDMTRSGVPIWAKLGDDVREAAAICARQHLGYQGMCQSHDASLANLDAHGQHLMFMATGTAINPLDKTVRRDQRLTIVLRSDGGGLVQATTKEGANYLLSAYTSASYTQHGEALMPKN